MVFARKARVSVMIVKVNGITVGYLVEQKNNLCASSETRCTRQIIGHNKNVALKMCVIAQTVELVTS